MSNSKVSLKERTFYGIMWSGVERFSVGGIMFLLQIVMARMLSPEDYGIVGMLAIFVAVAQSFVDSGFSNALIQKNDRTELDYSTVFYFNVVVGCVFYLLLFFSSPFIASFYKTPILLELTRVIGLSILFNSLTVVQRAKMTIAIDFKTQTKASFLAVVLSGVLGIWMAYAGCGVWAIAIQTVSNTGLNMILLWIYSSWKPKKVFSWNSFHRLFSFGSKLLLAGLIDTIYRNIFTLIIGKKFTKVELGNYTRADQFCQFPSANITGILQRVTFPILSELQNDDERLKLVYRKFLRLSAFVIFPLMIGLAAISRPFILLVLTEKWEGAIVLMQVLCLGYLWYPIHAINLNLLQVKGRSDLFLRLEIIKKSVGIGILFVTIRYGVLTMCMGTIVGGIIGLIFNTYYTGKLIQLGFVKQMLDLFPILINSIVMGGLVYFLTCLLSGYMLQILLGSIGGIIYYLVSSHIFHSQDLKYLFSLVKRK